MKHTQAVFSVKFEPIREIRDSLRDIENSIKESYLPLNLLPVPEDVFYDVPRMVAESKFKHSRLSVSQLSVDIVMNFDDDFSSDYAKVEGYIRERASLAKKILETLGVNEYLYFGIINNIELDTDEKSPVDFMREFVSNKCDPNAREITLRSVVLKDDKYFISKQYTTFERYDLNFPSPALICFDKNKIKDSGVALSLDINNRYGFSYLKRKNQISTYEEELEKILNMGKIEIDKEKKIC